MGDDREERIRRAVAAYRRTHFLARGEDRGMVVHRGECADPRDGPFSLLGTLERVGVDREGRARVVAYRTTKLGDEPVSLYTHTFAQRCAPLLLFHPVTSRLLLAGGSYRVTWRGIEDV